MSTPARYVVDQRKVLVAVAASIAICAYPFLTQKPPSAEDKPKENPHKKSTREERLEWMRSDAMPAK